MPGKLVSRMSNRKCITISDVDTIKSASQKFHENQIGCMPVLDKNNKVWVSKSNNLNRKLEYTLHIFVLNKCKIGVNRLLSFIFFFEALYDLVFSQKSI